jgi:putative membrane protein
MRWNMGRKDMGNIVEIMKSDFKSAFSNPIVTIILIGIIVLPSLYALLNIYACWDPYGNTDEVEFAVANLDNGSSFEGQNINIGNELVKELKNNTKFKWTFVTEKELRDGVYKGDYYAGMVIPRNLSENVLSIASDNPKQATLEYVVNIKANPVAAKLTNTAANTVYTNLNAKIIEYINLAAYGKLGELQEGLASGAEQLSGGGEQLQSGADQVSSGADQVSSGADQVSDGSEKLQEGSKLLEEKTKDLDKGKEEIDKNAKFIEEKSEELEKGSEEVQSTVDPSLIPEGPVKEYAEGNAKIADGSSQLAEGSGKLAEGSSKLAEGSEKISEGSVYLANKSNELAGGSAELAEGSVTLAAGAELLSNAAAQALFTASAALFSSADALSSITGINETLLGEYFFAPIKLDTHEIFPVPDYGSSLAPFYIVLSMWVGGLITCVMMEPKSSEGTKYSPFEMYAGKLLIYVIMSILQACVTLIGAHLLGIYVDNYALFYFSAILVSVVFMVLIYSVISAVGTVGKAIIVLLLVLQISSTGGIYPIEIMGKFFQMIHPYMPMTYAIKLVREAQLGVVWSNYIPALTILLAIGLITVVCSVIIKEKADKASKYFEERLEDSGLF